MGYSGYWHSANGLAFHGGKTGCLKMAERREQKQESGDGRGEGGKAHRPNKTELKGHKKKQKKGTHSGVKNRAKTQAVRERIESEPRRQCKHVQIVDEAEIRHRHAEDTRIRTVNDDIASVDDRTPQRLPCIIPFGNVKRHRYPDESQRQHRVGWKGDLSPPGNSCCFLWRVCHCDPCHASGKKPP